MVGAILFVVISLIIYFTRPKPNSRRRTERKLLYDEPTARVEDIVQNIQNIEHSVTYQETNPEVTVLTPLENNEPIFTGTQAAHMEILNIISALHVFVVRKDLHQHEQATNQHSEPHESKPILLQHDCADVTRVKENTFEELLKQKSIKQEFAPEYDKKLPISLIQKEQQDVTIPDHSIIDVNQDIIPIGQEAESQPERNELTNTLISENASQATSWFPIKTEPVISKFLSSVPHWPHSYVYSADEINYAKPEQRKFYAEFKRRFLEGQLLDIEGNTNYAFILFYDLQKAYRNHHDLALLERQYHLLAEICPKTQSYARNYLIKRMRETGDTNGAERLEWTTVSLDNRPDHQKWNWRVIYQEKLKLSDDDVALLNKVWISSNNFCNIEFIACELIKLYLSAMKVLWKAYHRQGLGRKAQFAIVLDMIARKQHRYHLNSFNYKHILGNDEEIYRHILRYCEKILREYYCHKRSLNIELIYPHPEVNKAFDEHVFKFIPTTDSSLLADIQPADESTEMQLNALSPTRWKDNIRLLPDYYHAVGKDTFKVELDRHLKLNARNPSLEVIYFEAAKFLSSLDKPAALQMYIQHVYYNNQNKKLLLKPLNKALRKTLFSGIHQDEKFELIVNASKQTADITSILKELEDFYVPARRKITLNSAIISQVEQEYSGTIEKLSVLLNDDELAAPPANKLQNEEAALPAQAENATGCSSSVAIFQVDFTQSEMELLYLFKAHNFLLAVSAIDDFCKESGTTKNAMINNINEQCYDLLDDLLIEEDQDGFYINLNYYNQILSI